MSGGKFDYKQYCIGDIADRIVMEIARAKRPLPPPTIRKGVYSKVKTGENSFSYDGRYWNYFESIDEAKECFRNTGGTKILSERTLPNGERELTVLHKRTNKTNVFTSYTEEVYLDEDGREIHQPEYSEETIKEFKNAIRPPREYRLWTQYATRRSLHRLVRHRVEPRTLSTGECTTASTRAKAPCDRVPTTMRRHSRRACECGNRREKRCAAISSGQSRLLNNQTQKQP